jgi:hypothetical protein
VTIRPWGSDMRCARRCYRGVIADRQLSVRHTVAIERYGVDVASGEDTPVILAIVVAIDALTERD